MRSIEQAIAASEATHPGEIRFVVEGALDGVPLLRGQTARERAIELFARLHVWDTEHNTGVLIYVLLAIPFRSYLQPLIVMSAIPFGFIGAIWGHVLMGSNLTILSGFGIVALTGVVVNDSLVMVDFINRARAEGLSLMQAVREAGVSRFRPIILTSLTTFAGLTPLLLERSLQAQFLIPMAISLAFGVLFATLITLILVPVLYTILEDVKIAIANLLNREQPGGDIIEAEQAG